MGNTIVGLFSRAPARSVDVWRPLHLNPLRPTPRPITDSMPANEVEATVRKELSQLSQRGVVAALRLRKWTPVQEKLLAKAVPKPGRFTDILRNTEGVAASSTHPGDWRFRDFDYE